MKMFLSYRRDDTGGRAGRLFDLLAAKYGSNHVFHDVSSATPGVDFTERIGSSIAESDVVLVVIGPNWLSSPAPTGGRRIDRADDFVRLEIRTALTTGKPVVPVLVDDAELPPADQLPDELTDLLRRHAVRIRDESWHQDVDHLVRQLEGDTTPVSGRRHRTALIAGVVVVLLALGAVALVLLDDSDSEKSGEDGQLTGCPVVDDSWTAVELADDPPVELPYDGGHVVEAAIVGGWTRTGDPDNDDGVMVSLEAVNLTEPVAGTFEDDVYLGIGTINGLLVNGIDQGDALCLSTTGDPELEPGERAIATVAYGVNVDPVGAPITLEVFDDVDLAVSRP